MRRLSAKRACALCPAACVAFAGAVARLAAEPDGHSPPVGDLMGIMQLRHIKLWYAGSNGNWQLLSFEATKMRDTIESAAAIGALPADMRAALDRALDAVARSATRNDEAGFKDAYARVTDGCNACHRRSGVSFIRIMTPTRSPFSDQAFDIIPPDR